MIALGYAYEQVTRHRRPPGSAPRALSAVPRSTPPVAGATAVQFAIVATGAQASPATDVGFRVEARLRLDEGARTLAFELVPAGPRHSEIGGVYLHRRTTRRNGGVAHVLAKSLARRVSGSVTLLEAELADLKAGKCYIAAVSQATPLKSVRADLVWPVV